MKKFIVFLLLGFIVYGNALDHPFMIDDHAFFDEMDHRWENLLLQFIPDKTKILALEGAKTEVYYRPMGVVISKIFYLLYGNKVFFFHLSSLVMFALACWMINRFFLYLFKDVLIAALAAVLYFIHPLNGILVNFKTGVCFSLQMICMIGSLHLTFSFLEHGFGGNFSRKIKSAGKCLAAVLLFISAMLCHESAMALPFYAVILLWALGVSNKECRFGLKFFADPFIRREEAGANDSHGDIIDFKIVWNHIKAVFWCVRRTMPLWLSLVAYFIIRMRWASLNENIFNKFASYNMGIDEYLATVAQMSWWYLSRVFYPQGIVISKFFPVEHAQVGIWLAVLAAMMIGWMWVFFRFIRNPVVVVSLLWGLIAAGLLAAGSIFQGSDLMIEPHWFIFPSLGIFLLLAAGLRRVWATSLRKLTILFLCVMALAWILISRDYNALWHNERAYCFYWLKENPNFKPIHMYIARSYFAERRYEQAAYHYQQALTNTYPDYLMYTNLGTIAFLQDNFSDAKKFLKKALDIEPRAKVPLNSLAILYLKEGDIEAAKKYLKRSIEVNRFNISSRWNLARVYMQEGASLQAKELYEQILQINPAYEPARNALKNMADHRRK